ncbi:MAG TPA: DNA polymerase [Candidatus Nanopelagicales bacterium]|nr:DNA polymerase [Candidatus Nanopelagicales bacterium]
MSVGRGEPLAVVVAPGLGVGLASADGSWAIPSTEPATVVASLEGEHAPRWVWWSARGYAVPLVAEGVRPRACWDLGAVSRLLYGSWREDEGAVWALHRGLDVPPQADGELSLLDLAGESDDAVRGDGQLSREWLRGSWARDLDAAETWARLALEVQQEQERSVRALPDRRRSPGATPLPYLTALSESMAALLAVELGHDGLAVDRGVLDELLVATIGSRPSTDAEEVAARRARDQIVWQHLPGGDPIDLRNPATVREALARTGIDVPDTRSWRLEPYAGSSPLVAALLRWRKAERIATTYGWGWAARDIGPDDRLRGVWGASEGAGRMTASAGLHNLPAELRVAVRPPDGRVLVRSDLGQIEPRVLAAVSGDTGLAAAAREDDMYAPVAAALRSDRPTAKVAVLAAMYGQTSGPAGEALKDMERAYPVALAFLREAEERGRRGEDLRTYGGRLLRLSTLADSLAEAGPESTAAHSYGRFARNAVVQGAAAELFKAWAATVRAGLAGTTARIVLCLHDELLVECDAPSGQDVAALVDTSLQSTAAWWCAGSGVRLVSDTSVVRSWDEAH